MSDLSNCLEPFACAGPSGVPHFISDVDVAIVGAGPAGLMAAEVLVAQGHSVHVFDRMPSAGRKFLLAGRGGLNLTHSEPMNQFMGRYGTGAESLVPILEGFDNQAVCAWAASLGIDTFVGSSGRVFPSDMKAAPLLRAWLHRLRHPVSGVGVVFHHRHRWLGWSDGGQMVFDTPSGSVHVNARATVLALGGGSWSRLGSDGAWVGPLVDAGVQVVPLEASNCGFDVDGGWSGFFHEKYAGSPLKSIALHVPAQHEQGESAPAWFARRGECVVTTTGLEGSVVYAASSAIRRAIKINGHALIHLDLLPDWSFERVLAAVGASRGSRSLSSHLKSRLKLDGVKMGLLHEQLTPESMRDPRTLAAAIKALPIKLSQPRPIDEAISTAGGVCFDSMTADAMLLAKPGVFCAGEMLDWDAPTGGYLLTACLATGRWAGLAVARYLGDQTLVQTGNAHLSG